MGSIFSRIKNIFKGDQYQELYDYKDMYNHHIMFYDDFEYKDIENLKNKEIIQIKIDEFTDNEDENSINSPEV